MAGLKVASVGQEYCRTGAVRNTQRQGAKIAGVVELSHQVSTGDTSVPQEARAEAHRMRYPVEVELQSPTQWQSFCSCKADPAVLCPHTTALLYQWLAHPMSFVTSINTAGASPMIENEQEQPKKEVVNRLQMKMPDRTSGPTTIHSLLVQHGPAPLDSFADIISRMSLSELRAMVREYDVMTNGMNKQQLADALLETLKQSEAVRRVAATLEKPQRQLLAALVLAGGSMTDEDLRGLYERFALGQPAQLQSILMSLQNKAFLFRTSLNSSAQQRVGLSGALLDVGWFVPAEVRTALRVTVPVTTFALERSEEAGEAPVLARAESSRLLADLLLIARLLNGYRLERDDERDERSPRSMLASARASAPSSSDGSMAIPVPGDLPSAAQIAFLRTQIDRPPEFLRFAVRLLRLADILHRDDDGTPYLRLLPNAAQLLLGPGRVEAERDLFELWLTQSSYGELYDLTEDGLRLRCRSTSLNHSILRIGELEAENNEARQSLIALLAQAPLDQWISFNAFARFVYRLNPLFLQKRQRLFSSPHWWIEQEAGRPLRPLQLNDWLRAELHYLTRLVRGPLHWWGICDIALSQDQRLLAFRLTGEPGWLYGEQPQEKEEASVQNDEEAGEQMLEVVGDEEILVASSPQAWPMIQLLEEFTEVAGVSKERLCYRLTPGALGEALSQGRRPDALLELLRCTATNGQEQNPFLARMISQLEGWIASYGRARIYTGVSLLEAADTSVMRELSATTSLDEQVVRAIHPTLLILKKPGSERVVEELKRRGQAPLLHDEEYHGAE